MLGIDNSQRTKAYGIDPCTTVVRGILDSVFRYLCMLHQNLHLRKKMHGTPLARIYWEWPAHLAGIREAVYKRWASSLVGFNSLYDPRNNCSWGVINTLCTWAQR